MSRVNVSKNQHTFVESMLPDLISVILATFELHNHIIHPRPIINHSFNKSCHHILKYRNFLKIFFYHEDPSNGYRSYLNKSVYVEAF